MTPTLTRFNEKQLGSTNRVVTKHHFYWSRICAYCANLFFRQFCTWIFNAAISCATLQNAISIVVGKGTNKKMCRITAGRIITSMQNIHAFWYFTVFNSPRHSVSKPMSFIGIKSTIPISITKGIPKPTIIRILDGDFPPKSIHGVLSNHGVRLAYCMGVD